MHYTMHSPANLMNQLKFPLKSSDDSIGIEYWIRINDNLYWNSIEKTPEVTRSV